VADRPLSAPFYPDRRTDGAAGGGSAAMIVAIGIQGDTDDQTPKDQKECAQIPDR